MKKTKAKKRSEMFDKLRKGIRSASFVTQYKAAIEYKHITVKDNLLYTKQTRIFTENRDVIIYERIYNKTTKKIKEKWSV